MTDNTASTSRPTDPDRFDIVLFGATGFTGKLVAEHLVKRAPPIAARIALAGRDAAKLERLRAELGEHARDFGVIVANVDDRASIDAMVRRARVLCTTVGPYATYGSDVVAACAEHGVHYCDLTGEPQWVRRMIDAHHDAAKQSGARIVPACGFDSIPSDIGVFMLQRHAINSFGNPCRSIKTAMTRLRGSASGGTIATMFAIQDELRRDRSLVRLLVNPYSLVPALAGRRGPDTRDTIGVRYDDEYDAWTAPFLMAYMNRKVVHRTNALTSFSYGEDFTYAEMSAFRRGPRGFVRAHATNAGVAALVTGMSMSPVRALLAKRLPKPGEGPSAEARARGMFEAKLVGQGPLKTFTIRGTVGGRGDPGYGATAPMIGEAALCLAKDALTSEGGVLTPASAMGDALLTRLRTIGMTFDVT